MTAKPKAEILPSPAPWVERMTVANKMLAEAAGDPQRASRVWDFAEAARVYAIQVGLGVEAVNHAVAVKLKSQRLLADAVDAGVADGTIHGHGGNRSKLAEGKVAVPDLLGENAYKRVSESRKIRDAFTDEAIDEAAREASETGEELTSAEMLSRARVISEESVGRVLDARGVPDTDVKRAQLRANASKAMLAVHRGVLALSAPRVAVVLDADDWERWTHLETEVADWFCALNEARPKRMRAVE